MKKQIPSVLIVVGVGVLFLILFSSSMFKTIQPGERGVIFRPWTTGLDTQNIYGEGLQVIAPWNTLFIYNVKEQQEEELMDVLDKEGLSISVEVSIRFNPKYNKIGHLHGIFGADYKNTLVIPEVRSSVRKVMGRYKAEEIFSTKRKEVEDAIFYETKEILESEKNNIEMTALLIRSIQLPPQIKQAIENKLKQQQEAEAYKYRLDKEQSEAERKKIEAEGISNYNKIISASLTDNILKQRGIEATIKLAESQNTKVIVVGSGKDGLPLILGDK